MGSVNKATIIGRLGADPELKYTQQGKAIANFSVATSESWTKDGKKEERTEWHRIVAWEKLAEVCAEHLKKGRQVYVEGKLQTRKWKDKNDQERQTTEIVAQVVTFLDDKPGGATKAGPETDQPHGATEDVSF